MPGSNTREHEAKFQIDQAQLSTLLTQAIPLDGYTRHPLGTRTHMDSYLETPAYELLRHGLTLRVRHNGTGYEVGIKSLEATRKGAIQERLDVTIPLTNHNKPFDVSTWPKSVEEQLDAASINLGDLRPLVVVRQERQKSHITSTTPASEPLAEWSLDAVWISNETISGETNRDETSQADFHELEIELLDADAESDFGKLVAQVEQQPGLTPIYTSKLVRGLALRLAQSHNGASSLTPEMELSAGCRLLLHQQLLVIMLNEHGVRLGERAAFVHDMRVAIRRARAAIRLFGDVFGSDTVRPYQKGLKRLGSALGDVRDLDVALKNLRKFRRSQPEDQRQGLKALRTELKSRRAHAHANLVTMLNSRKHKKFIADFNHFCATPGKHERGEHKGGELEAKLHDNDYKILPTQVRHTVPSIILRTFEALRAYEIAFAHTELPPLETFHATRIQSKYLRYSLEFTQHLLDTPGTDLITQLTEIQEHLGKLNDAHIEQERLHRWERQIENHAAIEERLSHIKALIDELTTSFPASFAQFISLENRQLLANALAHL